MGKKVAALITDMEQPLGPRGGQRARDRGVHRDAEGPRPAGPRVALARADRLDALPRRRRRPALEAARAKRVRDALASGAGLRKFQEVIEQQGGDPRVCDEPWLLPARAGDGGPHGRGGRARRARSAAARWATRPCCSAPAARRWTAGSTPRWASSCTRRSASWSCAGEPLLTVHVNDRAPPRRGDGPAARGGAGRARGGPPGPLITDVLHPGEAV